MAETWQVVDDDGAAHDVAVDEGRGPSRSWWAAAPDVARRSHASARDAVVLVAQACEWAVVEVLAPGVETRAEECGYLEARRGALLAEVDRLTAALSQTRAAWGRTEEAIALVLQAQSSAEPETLAREIGVRIGYPLLADVAMLAATAPTARAEGAREMRDRCFEACERVARAMAAQANAAASCDCGCGGASEAAFTYAAGGARECADAVQSEPIAVRYARCSTAAVAGGAQ
jgi:hypothetical protein